MSKRIGISFIRDVFEAGFLVVRVGVRCYVHVAQLIIALWNGLVEECLKQRQRETI